MKRALKKFVWALLGLFILFQIYFSVRVYWLVSCTIPTYSMSPTLVGGDYILASMQIPGRRIYKMVRFFKTKGSSVLKKKWHFVYC